MLKRKVRGGWSVAVCWWDIEPRVEEEARRERRERLGSGERRAGGTMARGEGREGGWEQEVAGGREVHGELQGCGQWWLMMEEVIEEGGRQQERLRGVGGERVREWHSGLPVVV